MQVTPLIVLWHNFTLIDMSEGMLAAEYCSNKMPQFMTGDGTCIHTHNRFMALWILSRTTRVSQYQKKHAPTDTCHGHQSSLICFLHLLRSVASSLFNLHAWQSFFTISLQVFFGIPLVLAPSTSYSIHFFTQSLSSFCNTCPYHCNLFCCSTEIMSSNPSLSTLYLELYLVAQCPWPWNSCVWVCVGELTYRKHWWGQWVNFPHWS